jgi:hypothetical protein
MQCSALYQFIVHIMSYVFMSLYIEYPWTLNKKFKFKLNNIWNICFYMASSKIAYMHEMQDHFKNTNVG